MKAVLLVWAMVAAFLIFPVEESLGVVAKQKNNPQLIKAQPRNNSKKPNSKNGKNSKQQTPEQRRKQQQLEQYRKKAEEQRRKQAEALAKRRKELEQHSKQRNERKFADLKKEISGNVATIGQLEQRFQSVGKKRQNLSEAVEMAIGKGGGDELKVIKEQLAKMKLELKAPVGASAKSLGSKWKGSGGGGSSASKDAPSTATLAKLEEQSLRIKRDRGQVEFELRKVETHYKSSLGKLFFCVGKMAQSGITFSSGEQDFIRSLSAD